MWNVEAEIADTEVETGVTEAAANCSTEAPMLPGTEIAATVEYAPGCKPVGDWRPDGSRLTESDFWEPAPLSEEAIIQIADRKRTRRRASKKRHRGRRAMLKAVGLGPERHVTAPPTAVVLGAGDAGRTERNKVRGPNQTPHGLAERQRREALAARAERREVSRKIDDGAGE